MKISTKIALLGAIMTLVPATALATSAGAVTVRVEGKTKTLLPATVVHLHSGSITKGGAPKGACSARSATGALDVATHHRWNGTYYSSFSSYLITSILGQSYSAASKDYWEFFVNGVSAMAGACAYTPHGSDQILFAAMPVSDSLDYTLVVTGAPRHATAGHPFTVTVDYISATGKKVALRGARLTGSDFAAVTTRGNGTATITPAKAGTLTLHASHVATTATVHGKKRTYGYVRAPSVTVHVTA